MHLQSQPTTMELHFLLPDPEEILQWPSSVCPQTYPSNENEKVLFAQPCSPPLMIFSGSKKVQLDLPDLPGIILHLEWPQFQLSLLRESKMLRAPVLEPEENWELISQVGSTKQEIILKLFTVISFEKAVVLDFQKSKGVLVTRLSRILKVWKREQCSRNKDVGPSGWLLRYFCYFRESPQDHISPKFWV